MEDVRINERESLALISRMIEQTRNNIKRYAAYPFLIWGYITVLLSVVVWFLLRTTGNGMWGMLWFLLPAIAMPITIYFSRKDEKGARSFVDVVLLKVWIVFGVIAFAVMLLSGFFHLPILFIIALLMSMATTITGAILNYSVILYPGIVGCVGSFLMCLFPVVDQLLFFGGLFLVMMVIPGHFFNYRIKQCLKN